MFTLKNKNGMQAQLMDYGATVVSLTAPDRKGKYEDVVTGYDELSGYINGTTYMGAIVGRYGNRIAKGKFSLDGKEYTLALNNGENHLHGGPKGFDKVIWNAEEIKDAKNPAVKFTYFSPDGEEGYPGNLTISVIYTLTDDNALRIDYSATTDKPTVLNPTNHCYFNLTGSFANSVLDHELMINADKFTPTDNGSIPTGILAGVEGTPMDFRKPSVVGSRICDNFEQLFFGKGYDHNWVLNNYTGKLREAAALHEPVSGRLMQVLTDQPGIQMYTSNYFDGDKGKNGVKYERRCAIALETQHFPDSPNKPHFPSTVLRPGEVFTSTTIYKFSVK